MEPDNVAKTDDIPKSKPKCISEATWERFQAIQKKTDEVTRRSTEKRIKHLQKTIIRNVEDKLTREEDRAVLREHTEHRTAVCSRSQTQQQSEHSEHRLTSSPNQQQQYTQSDEKSSGMFKEVEKYLGVNAHLKPGYGVPQTRLEQEIDKAVVAGDVDNAETLSDRLAVRDFGVKISEAVSARNYIKRKQEEDEILSSKKRKKLNWGFEHKQRWETKSNM